MFDTLKKGGELLKLHAKAKQIQKELESISRSVEKDGLRVRVNGNRKIEYLEIDGVERKDLKDLINNALAEAEKDAAKKMMEMGGGLGGLLGKL